MTHDVVVVGGGIVGLSSAYELALRGLDVVVIDRDQIGAGCAVGSAGHIVPSHVIPLARPGAVSEAVGSLLHRDGPLSVRWTMDPALWTWLAEFARNSRGDDIASAARRLSDLSRLSVSLIDQWISDNDIACHHRTDGMLDVYGDQSAFESATESAYEAAEHGVRVEILDGEAAREIEPSLNDSVVGAVRYPDDGNLDPAKFLSGLRAAVERAGVTLRDRVEMTGIDTSATSVTSVMTESGLLEAHHFVVATGAWSALIGRMLGERVPVVSGRGFSITIDRPTRGPRRALLLGEKHVAVGPMGDRLRLSGRFEVGEFGTDSNPKRIADIVRLARTRLDLDDDLTGQRTWAGLRPVTPDGVPIISPSSRWDNVTIATGHAMIGLSIGPGTGRIVADLVTGRQPDFSIDRFSVRRFQ